jgi:hypothetical protein
MELAEVCAVDITSPPEGEKLETVKKLHNRSGHTTMERYCGVEYVCLYVGLPLVAQTDLKKRKQSQILHMIDMLSRLMVTRKDPKQVIDKILVILIGYFGIP